MEDKNGPFGVRVVDDPNAEYYVVIGIFKNFSGYSKANFVSDSAIMDSNYENLDNFKLQDLFFGAHKFKNAESAIKIAEKYYDYYGTHSNLFAVYGITQDDTRIIWYQDGFYEYVGEAKSVHGDNWFYGIVDFPKIKEEFSSTKAPILFQGNKHSSALALNDLGVFPRENVILKYQVSKQDTTIVYYYTNPRSLDTAVSRLARLYSEGEREKYEESKIKKLKAREHDILRRAQGHYELSEYAMNERNVPQWLRSLARYGTNE